MTHDDVQAWLDRYVEAWRTYDPDEIGALFAEDVVCYWYPWSAGDDVGRGRDDVVRGWLAPGGDESARDALGTYDAEYHPFAVDGQRAVARGWTRYWTDASRSTVERAYDNVFLLEFAEDGTCRSSTELYMKRPDDPA